MSITQIDARGEIKRLEAAGYTVPKAGAEVVAASWAENMASVSRHDLAAAVTAVIHGDSSYWPKIGKLIGMSADARKQRPHDPARVRPLSEEYWAWERRKDFHDGTPCPVCGARAEWAPRLMTVHDEREHERAGIGFVGWSRADRKLYDEAATAQQAQAARPKSDDPVEREMRRQTALRRIRELIAEGVPAAVDERIERPVLELV